jgi:hypothetical protein
MNDLVERLGQPQEIAVPINDEKDATFFKEAVERGYPHITFVKTGTTLGIPMDKEASDVRGGDFTKREGKIKVVGNLVLNYNRVRFHGELDIATGKGMGRLEYLGDFKPGDREAS